MQWSRSQRWWLLAATREGCAPDRAGTRRAVGFGPPWPGAVSHSRIVAYGARSPARSAAEGHAQGRSASSHSRRRVIRRRAEPRRAAVLRALLEGVGELD